MALGLIPAAVALLSGCTIASGGGDSSDYRLRPVPASSTAAADTTDLTRVSLTGRDVPGQVVTTPLGDAAPSADDVSADATCGPIASVAAGLPVGSPTNTSVRQAAGKDVTSSVTLAVYRGGDAVSAMTELSTSADTCAGGFTLTVRDQKWQITRVTRELAPAGSDQAIAFDVDAEHDGSKAPVKVVVFRKGTTVGYLSATSGTSGAISSPLTDVVLAQLLKLS